MQKTRPRRKGKQTASTKDAERTPTVGRGRPTHVRNRLIVAVAVVAAAIAGAGAPSVIAASGQLSDSQDLVTFAERTQDALALAHSLADERDDVVPYIAAGRPRSKAPSEEHSARVDRQVEELRADPDTSEAMREELDTVAAVRRAALTGKSSALDTHQAYSTAITQLHRLSEQLAERTPPRAGSGGYALAELDSAVHQAAATRGLLLAALNVPSTTETVIDPITGLPTTSTTSSDADSERRDALTAAALQARLRSDAALAGFRDAAPQSARASYDSTVNGPEVDSAEKYLARLTDKPTLSDEELDTSTKKLGAALTARVETMRGVESALFDKRTKDLAQLRDDDVTELEIRIAVLGALMLLAVGIATAMARTLTRPLSVLRRGSARLAEAEDPATAEPVAFTGRNDEFAQVVRSVNALHAHAGRLAERIATLEADRRHLVGQRQKMADAREELRTELSESAAQLEKLRAGIGGTYVNLALRTLGLVERQLGVIEGLEEREDDPDRLATLFKLDHFATVMRRHSENLLVLAGTEHGRHTAGPVPLVDVVRAAVSEIERYDRVRIAALPPHAHIAGFAADDLSHLLAELLENATSFSPPDLPVEVSGWLLENGEVMLSVQDEGIGMAGDRLERLNARLSDFDPESTYDAEAEDGLGLGLYVVARLAHRHGVRVRLREQKQGGIAAVVVLPDPLLASATPTAVPASVSGVSSTVSLPGADAEANSNVLPGRTEKVDPLVELAENAVRDSAAAGPPPAPGLDGREELTPEGAADVDVPAGEAVADSPLPVAPVAAGAPEPSGPEEPAPGRAADVDVPAGEAVADSPLPVAPVAAGAPEPSGPEEPAPGRAAATGATPATAPAETRPDDTPTSRPGEEDQPASPAGPTAGSSHEEPGVPARDRASDAVAGHPEDTVPSPADAPADGPAGARYERLAETTMELLIPAQPAGAGAPRPPSPGVRPGAGRGHGAEPEAGPGGRPETEAVRPGTGHGSGIGNGAGARPSRPGADAPGAVDRPVAGDAQPGAGPESAAGARVPGGLPRRPDAEAAEHGRVEDGGADDEPVTDKGLPKRTPKISEPVAVPRPRSGAVDAEALRRRLGGFRRGADAGRRDVEAEIAERADTGRGQAPSGTTAPSEEATGGTVEEASS
ncbi:nitrate- and nitrite sensing domain-containing protein [Streptomyces sp. CHD11]|uniref:sensor histidine kinase n=1 Tax=Streptomyces sp. CHD11 TaxID=2741325 RepID=UPI001BFCA329|nr:nitrate- and nitrite sensing domain-containing protein [Streptomyces sp. CHD11]